MSKSKRQLQAKLRLKKEKHKKITFNHFSRRLSVTPHVFVPREHNKQEDSTVLDTIAPQRSTSSRTSSFNFLKAILDSPDDTKDELKAEASVNDEAVEETRDEAITQTRPVETTQVQSGRLDEGQDSQDSPIVDANRCFKCCCCCFFV